MDDDGQNGHVITRDMLRDGGIARMIAASNPGIRLLTDAERAHSLDQVMARRPDYGRGVWVFAYGSLIWNPVFAVSARRVARVHGWHRSFCLSTPGGRGTPEQPGLMLALDRGGACTGVALLIGEDHLTEEMPLLWRREMLAGSYEPRWVSLRGPDGAAFGQAVAFTIRRTGTNYVRLEEAEVVRCLSRARGPLGSGADYLMNTRNGLRSMGIVDPRIERLAQGVTAAQQNNPAGL